MTTRFLGRSTLLVSLVLAAASAARGNNASFRPGELWPDDRGVHVNAHGGGILDFEGRYYWFGEHKVEGEAGNSAQVGVHCYWSGDLYNWKDEGVGTAPWCSDDPGHGVARGQRRRAPEGDPQPADREVRHVVPPRAQGRRLLERAERGGGGGPGDGAVRLPGQPPAERGRVAARHPPGAEGAGGGGRAASRTRAASCRTRRIG